MSESLGPKPEGNEPVELRKGFIDPEKVLTPEEIEWCRKEADLDKIQKEFSEAFQKKWRTDGPSLSESVVISDSLEKSLKEPISLKDWTLASSAREKQGVLKEILPAIKITVPLSEIEPEKFEKEYYDRKPIGEFRETDPTRHLLPVMVAKDKAYFTFIDLFERESRRGNVVALDTMVFYKNPQSSVKPELYFGKPKTSEQAIAMIKAARGKEITVVTGIVAVGRH